MPRTLSPSTITVPAPLANCRKVTVEEVEVEEVVKVVEVE